MHLSHKRTTRRPQRDGLVTWATLLAVILLTVLVALVYNVGTTVNAKMHVQNASDAVAYSEGVWMARGMNAVTASNHLMGEVSALYILHHSLGADRLDEWKITRMPWWLRKNAIEWSYRGVQATRPEIPVISPGLVKEPVRASEESTLWQAKKKLKEELLFAYVRHAIGSIMAKSVWPPTVIAGYIMQIEAMIREGRVVVEYAILDGVHYAAYAVSPVKKYVLPNLLRGINTYTDTVVAMTPMHVQSAARAIGKEHDVAGKGPLWKQLPVVREKETGRCRKKREVKSQLMRATYPWVHYWRRPLLSFFGRYTPISKAKRFYMDYTNHYSYEIVKEFRHKAGHPCADPKYRERSLDLRLYVIEGLDPPKVDKSQEPWTRWESSEVQLADRMFGVYGVARQKESNRISAAPFFRQANPDGVVCVSQALVYNANPQQLPEQYKPHSGYQPKVGWDTLNWDQSGRRNRVVEYKTRSEHPNQPKIKLNWQAKLVPVSKQQWRSAQYQTGSFDSKIGNVMQRRTSYFAEYHGVLMNH